MPRSRHCATVVATTALAAGLWAGAGAGVDAFAAPAADLPPPVRQELAEMVKSCREAGGQPPAKPQDMVHSVDLSGDGVPDHVVYQGAFGCDGAASLFSLGAQGGGQLTVYVAMPGGGARTAFRDGVLDLELDRQAKPPTLRLTGRGAFCGQKVNDRMARSDYVACWRALVWNPRSNRMELAPLSKMQLIR